MVQEDFNRMLSENTEFQTLWVESIIILEEEIKVEENAIVERKKGSRIRSNPQKIRKHACQ